MRGNKAGLADLKRMHEKAQAARKAVQAQTEAADKFSARSVAVLSEDALKLFARATQTVQPIQAKGRVLHKRSDSVATIDLRTGASQSDAQALLIQKRMRATGQTESPQKETTARPQPGISDTYAPIRDTESEIAWSAPGIGPDTLRRLKQAFWPVGAHLDLHGMNSDQARVALLAFIDLSQQHATRCVRIVHGQGYGSVNGQAVLKNLVTQWLAQIPEVSAFVSAPAAHGGRGALLALIRQP